MAERNIADVLSGETFEVGRVMEDVVSFVNSFLADEYTAQVASLTERNYELLMDRVRKVDGYFRLSSGVSSGIGRAKFLPESLFVRMRNQAERTVQRRLFLVVRHDHPDLGPLYKCVLGSATKGSEQNYAEMLYVGNIGDGLQILTRLALCATCNGTGAHRSEKCPDCATLGWLHRGGMRLTELGKHGGSLKIEPPGDAVQRELYETA